MSEKPINPGDDSGSTMLNGAPAASDRQSITLGPDGPLLLHDHHLVNSLAHFNRENIPDRKPHAKGAGAFGELVITHDISKYTKAALFQPGARTRALLRFSTVAGEAGSCCASPPSPVRPAPRTPGAMCAASP